MYIGLYKTPNKVLSCLLSNEGLSGCFHDSLNLVADEFHDTALILTNYPSFSCAFFRVRSVCKQRWTS